MTVSIPKWLAVLLLVVAAAGAGVAGTLLLTDDDERKTRPRKDAEPVALTAREDADLSCAKEYEMWLASLVDLPEPQCRLSVDLDPGDTVENVLGQSDKTLSSEVPSEGQTVAAYLSEMAGIARDAPSLGSGKSQSFHQYNRLLQTLPD